MKGCHMKNRSTENSLPSKGIIDNYRNRARELHEKDPKKFIHPRTAMIRFWKSLKLSYLELVYEGKIDVTKNHMTDKESEIMWNLIFDRDIERRTRNISLDTKDEFFENYVNTVKTEAEVRFKENPKKYNSPKEAEEKLRIIWGKIVS